MLLKTLTLRNFGLFRGKQVLNLIPRRRHGRTHPIVLVGGHNGAGKTTILDAVRLCLYGRLALGSRITDVQYHRYLREHIHHNPELLIPVSYASVTLEFDYAHSGRRFTYEVQRSWETKGDTGVVELLRVLRDNEPVDDVDSEFWSEFVRSLVPPGVSQLFFFDGEKIKRLADEDSESIELAESVKALLGLDLVERLQADLDLYASRYVKKTTIGSRATRLSEIDAVEHELQRDLGAERVARQQIEEDLLELDHAIRRAEDALAQRGEGLVAQRAELRDRKAKLNAEVKTLEKALRDIAEGSLPFLLCPETARALSVQLDNEAQHETWEASRAEIGNAMRLVREHLTCGEFPKARSWDRTTRRAVQRELERVQSELFAVPADFENFTLLHGVSTHERRKMQDTLAASRSEVVEEARGTIRELADTEGALREVQRRLNSAPDSEEIAPLVRQLSSLQESHAKLTLDATLRDDEIARLERELAALEREREKILHDEQQARKVADRLELARRTRIALEEYLGKLAEAKIAELRSVALECFQRLCRKDDLVRSLEIDPRTFQVRLVDSSGKEIPKAVLSAGEKQIYAISLLWALARVSGRPLPMIIDTPMGRLDSVHRKHLVERYFPFAAHQVVILSTDTEVDRQYFERLQPQISHAIHLENRSGRWTEAVAGYFWEKKDDASASA